METPQSLLIFGAAPANFQLMQHTVATSAQYKPGGLQLLGVSDTRVSPQSTIHFNNPFLRYTVRSFPNAVH